MQGQAMSAELSITPQAELWARYSTGLYRNEELGFSLDLSRVRMSPSEQSAIAEMFPMAFSAMAQLEAGSIANKDEGRMVGHYWLRAPQLAPTPELEADILQAIFDVKAFCQAVHAGEILGHGGKFTDVLLIGIGGSALGPQFIATALASSHDKLHMSFFDNTDPDGIDLVLSSLASRLSTTLVVVVSKSGGTPETRNGMLEAQAAFQSAGIPFAPQAVAITQAGSKLDQTAQSEGWLKTFPMWDWVGGRTSVMSTVGLVPAALQGLDIDSLLEGAGQMDSLTRVPQVKENPAALLAMAWYHCGQGRGSKDMVLLPYKDRLALFSKYLQQLVMESLGKELDRKGQKVNQGIAVYGNKGSTDQHAYVQQLRDGLNNFFATFIEVLKDRQRDSIEVDAGVTSGDYLYGFYAGTRKALYESGRDSITITVNEVNAHSVGALIALYERAVGLYAELVNINAYHQPGVEAGKKAAAQILALQSQAVEVVVSNKASLTADEVAKLANASDVESIYGILRHLAANPSRGIVRQPGKTPAEDRFGKL
ncbi:Glucose-6-phosphate isomerase [Planctopirus ephydatiae]|uniref:Glucose-6-phosphate isomerase n=2 Tax=Planctopirus ephydatiae TaxID=2528019 RepID=A0A518GJC5_9PLAN|nr:Glucose-6-phosphate isomerase [Planctopirus ephydatiae]